MLEIAKLKGQPGPRRVQDVLGAGRETGRLSGAWAISPLCIRRFALADLAVVPQYTYMPGGQASRSEDSGNKGRSDRNQAKPSQAKLSPARTGRVSGSVCHQSPPAADHDHVYAYLDLTLGMFGASSAAIAMRIFFPLLPIFSLKAARPSLPKISCPSTTRCFLLWQPAGHLSRPVSEMGQVPALRVEEGEGEEEKKQEKEE